MSESYSKAARGVAFVAGVGVGALLLIPAVAAVIALRGFVLAHLWAWFVVPPFGLPALTVAQAVGIALVVGFLMPRLHVSDLKKEDDYNALRSAARDLVFVPVVSLAIGWLVKACVL